MNSLLEAAKAIVSEREMFDFAALPADESARLNALVDSLCAALRDAEAEARADRELAEAVRELEREAVRATFEKEDGARCWTIETRRFTMGKTLAEAVARLRERKGGAR